MSPSRHPALLALLAFCVIAVGASRAPWMDRDIWNLDEGVTYTLAQQVLAGDVLYRDGADHRSPLVPYLKAVVLALCGDWNIKAVQIALAAMIGGIAFGLGWIGRQLGGWTMAWATAITACFLQIYWIDFTDAMSANTGWYLVAFSTTAFALFVGSIGRPSLLRGLGVGMLFGGALLCKQPGLLDMLVALILIALLSLRAESARRRKLWLFGIAIIAGTLIPFAGFSLHYYFAGAWDDYIYYAFTFNTEVYVPEVPWGERLGSISKPFSMLLHNAPLIGVVGILAGVGLLVRALPQLRKDRSIELLPWMILGWTAAGLVSTTLSGREFAHYSEQVIPGLSLAVGWAFSRLTSWRWPGLPRFVRPVQIFLVVGLLVSVVIRNGQIKHALTEVDGEAHPVGTLAARFSDPGERIFVWGYWPELYVDARRIPASRYVYTNFVTGLIPWTNLDPLADVSYAISPDADLKLAEDLADKPPAIIVDTTISRGYSRFPIEEQAVLWDNVTQHYAQVVASARHDYRMRIFRRLEPSEGGRGPIPDFVGIPAGLEIEPYFDLRPGSRPMIEINGPTGIGKLHLLVGNRVHASLRNMAELAVHSLFFLPESYSSEAPIWVVAEQVDGTWIRSEKITPAEYGVSAERHRVKTPTFEFAGRAMPPSSVGSVYPVIVDYNAGGSLQKFRAPAHFRFPFPRGLREIRFVHGMVPDELFRSDGYDISLFNIGFSGEASLIWQRRLQPFLHGKDHFAQHETVPLPNEPGRELEFRFTTGVNSNAYYDHLYFGEIVGTNEEPIFWFRDHPVLPLKTETSEFAATHEGHWLLHAPGRISWPRPDDMMAFSFDYGVSPGAYENTTGGHTDGVGFEVSLVGPDGATTTLWQDLLHPFSNPTDRGVQRAVVVLPPDKPGELVLSTNPGTGDDKSWDWGFADNFTGTPPGPPLRLSDGVTLHSIGRSGYNGGWSDRQSARQWGAQTPQELVYPKPANLQMLRIRFGIVPAAAWDENGNRRSDGTHVRVIFQSDDGNNVELFERRLDPYNRPADAGMHEAEFTGRPGEQGKLLIRMEPGPNHDESFDWAFWGEFEGVVIP